MSKKFLVFSFILIIIAGGVFAFSFSKKGKQNLNLFELKRGSITQVVSETGSVKKGERINLSFKNSGRIKKIYVKEGDKIQPGQVLAKLETQNLEIQLQEAKAALASAQAQLKKLLAGASQEEIQLAKTAVSNAQVALDNAKQNLKDIQAQTKENLRENYENALTVLNDADLKIYNSFTLVDLIKRNYFIFSDQAGIKVGDSKTRIKRAMEKEKASLDLAKKDAKPENIDKALSDMREALQTTSQALGVVRQACEEPFYRSKIPQTEKTALDTQRTYVNSSLSNIISAQNTISLTKINNEASINTAKAKVSEAEGQLQAAKDKLNQLLAPPRKEDVEFYQAKIKQAEAKIQLLEKQIQDSVLKSEVAGEVIKVNFKEGEVFQPISSKPVIVLLPENPFQVKVDIYEENISKIKINDPVKISLVAFPDQVF